MKALFGLPLRQTTGLVESQLKLAWLDRSVPDFSTLSRRQKGLNVAIPYRPGTGDAKLAYRLHRDQAVGEGEWFAKKHGPYKLRKCRKVHLGTDADTLEIKAIEVSGSRVADAPMLPELVNQIPADQRVGKVSAPSTRACHTAIAARDACAVKPARKNARSWLETTPGAHARDKILRATPLRANKSETFDCLKFTLEGAGERSAGNARTSAHALACRA